MCPWHSLGCWWQRWLCFAVRCAELQLQLTEAVSTLAGQKELVAKLEQDLSTIQALSAVHRPDAEVPPAHSPGAASQSLGECSPPLLILSFFLFFPSFSFFLIRDLHGALAVGRGWYQGHPGTFQPFLGKGWGLNSIFPTLGHSLSLQGACPAGMRLQPPALPRHLWVGGKCLIPSACAAQGAASPGLEKIPEPIKEATALFYGERGEPSWAGTPQPWAG